MYRLSAIIEGEGTQVDFLLDLKSPMRPLLVYDESNIFVDHFSDLDPRRLSAAGRSVAFSFMLNNSKPLRSVIYQANFGKDNNFTSESLMDFVIEEGVNIKSVIVRFNNGVVQAVDKGNISLEYTPGSKLMSGTVFPEQFAEPLAILSPSESVLDSDRLCESSSLVAGVRRAMKQVCVLDVAPDAARQTCPVPYDGRLADDASNLPAVLNLLKKEAEPFFTFVLSVARSLLPVDDLLFPHHDADGVRLVSRSGKPPTDKAIALYAILCALTQISPPARLIIKNPEQFLPPRAIKHLLALMPHVNTEQQVFVVTKDQDLVRSYEANHAVALVPLRDHAFPYAAVPFELIDKPKHNRSLLGFLNRRPSNQRGINF